MVERSSHRGRFGPANAPVVELLRSVAASIPVPEPDVRLGVWIAFNKSSAEAGTRSDQLVNQTNISRQLGTLADGVGSDLDFLAQALGVSRGIAFAIRLGQYAGEVFTEEIRARLSHLFSTHGVGEAE